MVFLGLCAAAGAIVPWYFNLSYCFAHGRMFTPSELLAAGFTVSPLHSSIAADFWIGTTPALVSMIIEGRRLGMRAWCAFIVVTFTIAFAPAFSLFLLMREVHRQRAA